MASTYATATTTGTTKLGAMKTTSEQRDLSSLHMIENPDPSYKNSADIKRSFAKCFPKNKLLFGYRTTRGHIHLEFESVEELKEIESEWQQGNLQTASIESKEPLRSDKRCAQSRRVYECKANYTSGAKALFLPKDTS